MCQKDDMTEILEMVESLRSHYLSLPQYEGLLQRNSNTTRYYVGPYYQAESAAVGRDEVEAMIDPLVEAHVKMVDNFCRKLDPTYAQLNTSIGWVSKILENL